MCSLRDANTSSHGDSRINGVSSLLCSTVQFYSKSFRGVNLKCKYLSKCTSLPATSAFDTFSLLHTDDRVVFGAVPVVSEQLREAARVVALRVSGAELLEVFTWDRERLIMTVCMQ